jgi:hypothetical protein
MISEIKLLVDKLFFLLIIILALAFVLCRGFIIDIKDIIKKKVRK